MMVWAEEYGLQIERKFCKHSYILDLLDPILLSLLLLKDFFYDLFCLHYANQIQVNTNNPNSPLSSQGNRRSAEESKRLYRLFIEERWC